MTAKLIVSSVLLLVLGSADLWPEPCHAQDREQALDKILNPMPDYDPFEKSTAAAPQFFPDAVDKRSRELLIDALTNQQESLKDHLQFFKDQDSQLQKEYSTSTGLTDRALDLVNNTIQDRQRYLAAQEQALKNTSAPERKKYLQSIINNDDLNQADDLIRQSSTNQWGGFLNRMLGSVDLAGVASGNYIGAAAETVISQLYALTDPEMAIEERRALSRHLDHLKRFPNDPRNAEILRQVEGIEGKKKSVLVKKQLARGDEALGKGEVERAMFYYEMASFIDPESKSAEKALQKATRLYREQQEARNRGLASGSQGSFSSDQEQDVAGLLSALSLRDPALIERHSIDVEKKHHGKPLGDAALDTEAVALEIRGQHEAAKRIIDQLARSSKNPDLQKRAAALLGSPEYNLLGTFQDARNDRRIESVKYVLLGEDLLKKNLIYAAGAMAAAGPAGGATLGAVNAMMIGNNLVNVISNNPISAQPVIDAGVAYIRSHPTSENASEVYTVLADAYAERGMFDKAVHFHQLADTPKEKIAALKEKAGSAMLNAATKAKGRGTQEYYLTTIIDEYPESPAAAEATKKLAALVKSDNQGLRMSKQFLVENPELYGANGLGLKPSLFDGNPRNMELADRGVNLLNDNEILIHYQTPWGIRSQSYSLSKPATERFFTTLRQKNHEVALADIDQRAKGTVGGIKNMPTPILEGVRGKSTEKPDDNQDSTFSFIRQADGTAPAFPRVLDHELLSENELNPGSKYLLPPIQGSISASRFSMTGALPTGLWGNQVAIGNDPKSPYAGVQLPIPLLQGFIPVDFMVQGRPGGFSVYPKIHTRGDKGADPELYK
jgi:tetratricopeptide (TPR) repeat protein